MTPIHTLRQDLAAAFRWAARLNMHESIANHFSVATDDTGREFLLNPMGAHFSLVRASELLLLNVDQPETYQGPNAPDPTAWTLHAALHQQLPQARCVLHTHMHSATTLCCLKDFEFLMLDQNACRFHQRIAYDRDYSGMALQVSEGRRVAQLMGPGKSVLFMGNHGVIVVAPTVAQAFDALYYLEKAAELQVLALSTGRALAVIPEPVAALACAQWNAYPTRFSELHFDQLKLILDQEEPDYKT
jgi:ribulose-5-phosphate 4-epimerase/fuculose-1-phosphate aldolase